MSNKLTPLLKVENLKVAFEDGTVGLKDLTMSVNEGEIVGLIGLADSGKSLALQAIMGQIEKQNGKIEFNGENVEYLDTSSRIKSGISYVPQKRKVFENVTVRENLVLGGHTIKDNETVRNIMEECLEIFPRLRVKTEESAGKISSGERMMLGIARALMSDPMLLMIDELCLGISPLVRDDIFEKLLFLRDTGLTILVAEQRGLDILEIVDRAYLLDKGRVIAIGKASDFKKNEKIIKMFKREDD